MQFPSGSPGGMDVPMDCDPAETRFVLWRGSGKELTSVPLKFSRSGFVGGGEHDRAVSWGILEAPPSFVVATSRCVVVSGTTAYVPSNKELIVVDAAGLAQRPLTLGSEVLRGEWTLINSPNQSAPLFRATDGIAAVVHVGYCQHFVVMRRTAIGGVADAPVDIVGLPHAMAIADGRAIYSASESVILQSWESDHLFRPSITALRLADPQLRITAIVACTHTGIVITVSDGQMQRTMYLSSTGFHASSAATSYEATELPMATARVVAACHTLDSCIVVQEGEEEGQIYVTVVRGNDLPHAKSFTMDCIDVYAPVALSSIMPVKYGAVLTWANGASSLLLVAANDVRCQVHLGYSCVSELLRSTSPTPSFIYMATLPPGTVWETSTGGMFIAGPALFQLSLTDMLMLIQAHGYPSRIGIELADARTATGSKVLLQQATARPTSKAAGTITVHRITVEVDRASEEARRVKGAFLSKICPELAPPLSAGHPLVQLLIDLPSSADVPRAPIASYCVDLVTHLTAIGGDIGIAAEDDAQLRTALERHYVGLLTALRDIPPAQRAAHIEFIRRALAYTSV